MKAPYAMMREGIKSYPSSLLFLPPNLQKIAAKSLPYSVGIEVECRPNDEYEQEIAFRRYMIDKTGEHWTSFFYDFNFDKGEQTFRLREGITGLIALDHMCNFLQIHYTLNPKSGIHYHVNMNDVNWRKIDENLSNLISSHHIKRYIPDRIVKSLESWNYKGSYNNKGVGTVKQYWGVFREHYKTFEIRIGEMSFDYRVLSKRVIHACEIVRKLKQEINSL